MRLFGVLTQYFGQHGNLRKIRANEQILSSLNRKFLCHYGKRYSTGKSSHA